MTISAPPGPNDSYAGRGNASGGTSTTPKPIGTPYGVVQKWDQINAPAQP